MSKRLDRAIEAVWRLPADRRDEIAEIMLAFADRDEREVVRLRPSERCAIARSQRAAARGDYATDEQVQAVWAMHER